MQIKDSRTLITGASSGIGKDLAIGLGREGARLALAARRLPELQQTAELVVASGGPRPIVIPADLSVPGEAARLASKTTELLGGIDILVNNAASYTHGPVWSLGDSEQARALMETNYWSAVALLEAVIPDLMAKRSGLVVTISSVALSTNWPRTGHYASSKAALAVIAETLCMELEGSGVRVLHAVPGPVRTPMHEAASSGVPGITRMMRLSPLGTTEVLVTKIVRAIERDKSRVVYPGFNNVPLHFPRSTVRLLSRIARRAVPRDDLHRVELRSAEGSRKARKPKSVASR